jgi:hypothetical protein
MTQEEAFALSAFFDGLFAGARNSSRPGRLEEMIQDNTSSHSGETA